MSQSNVPAPREPGDVAVRTVNVPARQAKKEGPGTPLGPSPFPGANNRQIVPAALPDGAMRRRDLAEAVRFLMKIVERRAALPILSHLLFRKGEAIGTNLDLTLRVKVENAPALDVAVPAELLERVVRSSKDPLVRIEPTGNKTTPSVLVDGAMLVCVEAKDFPSVDAAFEEKDPPLAEVSDLPPRITALLPAVSTDETRFNLSGVYFEPAEGCVTATDGHRLHHLKGLSVLPSREIHIPASAEKAKRKSFLVSPRAVSVANQIRRAVRGPVRVTFNEKIAAFACGPYELSARHIEGEFPNYRQVIPDPKKMPGRITASREALIGAVGAVRVCTSEASKGIRLRLDDGKLAIEAKDPDKGEARREIPCEGEFPPVATATDPGAAPSREDKEAWSAWHAAKARFDRARNLAAFRENGLGVNPRYLVEALSALEGETVTIRMTDECSPLRLEDPNLFCIIMPMRL